MSAYGNHGGNRWEPATPDWALLAKSAGNAHCSQVGLLRVDGVIASVTNATNGQHGVLDTSVVIALPAINDPGLHCDNCR